MELLDILILAAGLGSAVVAGIFYAFSTFIMRALARLPASQGIAAMQAINITVITPLFFLAFFGTAVVCLPVAYLALGVPHQATLLAGCALYLFGCILVTGAGNVPLNNRLAKAAPDSNEAHELWRLYLSRWTFWNHVRTVASLAAGALFGVALWGGS